MAEILKKHGFEIIEINTPGKLDIDILFKNKTLIKDPYWINLLKLFEKEDLNKLQNSIIILCESISKYFVSSTL
jgi:hypothetical protein